MEVRDLIGGEVVSVGSGVTLGDAAQRMIDMNIGALAVIDDGELIGIITERDLVAAAADTANFEASLVRSWMTKDPDRLDPDMSVDDAADWMLAAGYRHLPVADGSSLIGIVSIKDVLWALTDPSGG